MELFQSNNTEEVSQMIINGLETYKKLLICEPELQNKFSNETLDTLIRALLAVLCYRKEYEHLNSMVNKFDLIIFAISRISR